MAIHKQVGDKWRALPNVFRASSVILAIVILVGGLYFVLHLSSGSLSKNVTAKVDSLVKGQDCKKGLSALASVDTGVLDNPAEEKVLNYRADCSAKLGKYSDASLIYLDLAKVYQGSHQAALAEQATVSAQSMQDRQYEQETETNERNSVSKGQHENTPVL